NMQEVMTFSTNLGVKNLVNKVNQSDSKSVQQTFDANNNLTCRKDEENRVTSYEYLSPTLDLPRFIRRPSVATGQTFETEIVYGDAGHPNLPTQIIQR